MLNPNPTPNPKQALPLERLLLRSGDILLFGGAVRAMARVRARARAKARARVRVKVRVSPNPNPGPGARDGARGRGPRGGLGARLAPPRRGRGLEKSVYHLSRALTSGGRTAVFDDATRPAT